jgi:hypothetical protein
MEYLVCMWSNRQGDHYNRLRKCQQRSGRNLGGNTGIAESAAPTTAYSGLISHSFNEELGAIGFEEEFRSLKILIAALAT